MRPELPYFALQPSRHLPSDSHYLNCRISAAAGQCLKSFAFDIRDMQRRIRGVETSLVRLCPGCVCSLLRKEEPRRDLVLLVTCLRDFAQICQPLKNISSLLGWPVSPPDLQPLRKPWHTLSLSGDAAAEAHLNSPRAALVEPHDDRGHSWTL